MTYDPDYRLIHPEYWEPQPIGDDYMACGMMTQDQHSAHWCTDCERYEQELDNACVECIQPGFCNWIPIPKEGKHAK